MTNCPMGEYFPPMKNFCIEFLEKYNNGMKFMLYPIDLN